MTTLSPGIAPQDTLGDVAVLMPAYNGQADVERTLASFAEAEGARVHVLIVDDGSTPPIVAPALPHMDIEILRMPQNAGIERALEAGIEALAVRGYRYAARIDAGDLAAPNRLATQRAYLEAHPNVAGHKSSRAKARRCLCCARRLNPTRYAVCVFFAPRSCILR
jgi:glycosyltransferase involved in cell wall biosynthesis